MGAPTQCTQPAAALVHSTTGSRTPEPVETVTTLASPSSRASTTTPRLSRSWTAPCRVPGFDSAVGYPTVATGRRRTISLPRKRPGPRRCYRSKPRAEFGPLRAETTVSAGPRSLPAPRLAGGGPVPCRPNSARHGEDRLVDALRFSIWAFARDVLSNRPAKARSAVARRLCARHGLRPRCLGQRDIQDFGDLSRRAFPNLHTPACLHD